jgi:hypothetical protein
MQQEAVASRALFKWSARIAAALNPSFCIAVRRLLSLFSPPPPLLLPLFASAKEAAHLHHTAETS